MLLWRRFREHQLEKCCCGIGFVDIGWTNVAVAAVSWVSVFIMWLWLVFWACQNLQKRSRLTPVQRNRFRKLCDISPTTGAGTPERVGRGTVYQFSVSVISYQLTGDWWGRWTGAVTRVYTPLGRWPRRIVPSGSKVERMIFQSTMGNSKEGR